jgi:pantoate--beta-alanine ligase
MNIVRTIDELHRAKGDGRPAFVPTMGALHEGHLALIRKAKELASPGTPVVASIFVNPTQFGPTEDFSRYPRMLDADAKAATAAGAQIIFAPEVQTMYPSDRTIEVPPLPAVATEPKLEDAFRPTHFAGVCQVVARLFDLVQPLTAVFGEKDYQQLLVIKAMVEQEHDRWAGLKIVAHPTIREPDGLAMSSRNAYLKPKERDRALGLFRALRAASQLASERVTIANIEQTMHDVLHEHELKIDYAAVRNGITLTPLVSLVKSARALIAARLGKVRLIDNLAITA